MRFVRKFWLTLALVPVASVIFLEYPFIDNPPPYIGKYYPIPTHLQAPWANENIILAELWIAECGKYEKDGVEYNLIYAQDSDLGTVFKMDCYGNVEWPQGQEFGVMFMARALKENWR